MLCREAGRLLRECCERLIDQRYFDEFPISVRERLQPIPTGLAIIESDGFTEIDEGSNAYRRTFERGMCKIAWHPLAVGADGVPQDDAAMAFVLTLQAPGKGGIRIDFGPASERFPRIVAAFERVLDGNLTLKLAETFGNVRLQGSARIRIPRLVRIGRIAALANPPSKIYDT